MTADKIKELIAKQLGLDSEKINEDSEFVTDLGADSLDIIQLLIGLEREFSIVFDEEQIKNVKTVGDIISFIESQN